MSSHGVTRHPKRRTIVLLIAVAGGLSAAASAQAPPRMYRGGPAQSGVTDTRGPDDWGRIAWRFQTDGPVRSSPIVADGVVYVGSADGRLYAVDALTGVERWHYEAGAPIGGAPLVTDAIVVVVDRANRIHAVRRDSGESVWVVSGGTDLPLVWGLEGWDYTLASPMLSNDLVVTGTGDGRLYGIGLDSGEVRWTFQTDGRIRSAPTIHAGVAYIGAGDGIVYGVSVSDGKEVWRFETAGRDLVAEEWGFDRTQIYSSPTIRDGVLYVGSRDASLYAVDLASGKTRWTFEDGTSWVIASPAVTDTVVVSARSSNGRVRALAAAHGAELWSFATGGFVFSSPVIAGRTAYVGSGNGRLHALDVATGQERWAYQTDGGIFSTPAVWDEHLYVGSDDGYLYAFVAGVGPKPHAAVFWDDALMSRAVLGRDTSHKRIADYFAERGYAVLDSGGAEAFLRARVRDRAPSVLIAAMDAVPSSLAASDGTPLLRQYLDAGGKIVWIGFPPLVFVRNDSGAITGLDRSRPSELLGIDYSAFNSDEYGIRVTDAGRLWGLGSSGTGMPLGSGGSAVTVLERTYIGYAAAWVKEFGGPPGTGFVHVRIGVDEAHLAELRRVAEYGVFRVPKPGRP